MKRYFDGIKLTNDSNAVPVAQWIYHSTTIDDYNNPKWLNMELDEFYDYCEHNHKFRSLVTYQGIECFKFNGFNTIEFKPGYRNTERCAHKISNFNDDLTTLRTVDGCYTVNDNDEIIKVSGYGKFVSTELYDHVPQNLVEFAQALKWQYDMIDKDIWKLLTSMTPTIGTAMYISDLANPTTVQEYIDLCDEYEFEIDFDDIACMQQLGVSDTDEFIERLL